MRARLADPAHAGVCPATYGIDVNPKSIVHGVAKNLSTMDAVDLRYDDEQFDHVYSFHAIEHIVDAGDAIAEMQRVLVPGGRILLVYPAEPIRGLYAMPGAWIGFGNPFLARELHVHAFTPSEDSAARRAVRDAACRERARLLHHAAVHDRARESAASEMIEARGRSFRVARASRSCCCSSSSRGTSTGVPRSRRRGEPMAAARAGLRRSTTLARPQGRALVGLPPRHSACAHSHSCFARRIAGASLNNLVVAQGGEAARVMLVARGSGVPASRVTSALALERVLDGVSYLMLLTSAAFLLTSPMLSRDGEFRPRSAGMLARRADRARLPTSQPSPVDLFDSHFLDVPASDCALCVECKEDGQPRPTWPRNGHCRWALGHFKSRPITRSLWRRTYRYPSPGP